MDEERLKPLADLLKGLGSPTRLAILRALRTPRGIGQILVEPTQHREGRAPATAMSRQGVSRHLQILLDLDLIRRAGTPGAARAPLVVNHERLFAVVDELRSLARLRPTVETEPGATMVGDAPRTALRHDGPRLFVAYGVEDGHLFPLVGAGPWCIGRSPSASVRLDYDPFLSAEHAEVRADDGRFVVRDLDSRNGTWINAARLAAGGSQPLDPGDVVTVGRSTLVFQP